MFLPEPVPALPDDAATPTNFRWATVVAGDPLSIQLDGDTAPLPVVPDSLLRDRVLDVGARVWVQLFGTRVIVLGTSAVTSARAMTSLTIGTSPTISAFRSAVFTSYVTNDSGQLNIPHGLGVAPTAFSVTSNGINTAVRPQATTPTLIICECRTLTTNAILGSDVTVNVDRLAFA